MTDSAEADRHGPVFAVVARAVFIGMLVMFVGTIPRNLIFAANLRLFPLVPWAVPVTALYVWFFWRYLRGAGPPASTADIRRAGLQANPVKGVLWAWALLAGGLGIVALVLGLWVANRLIVLPAQNLPNLAGVPRSTVLSLLLMAAPIAGVIEEAAFRGYMQGPIERRCGLAVAILITGTMFALAHLDFTLILWPYYVAVSAIYGLVSYLTRSILPALVLHTCGNLYSNIDLWLHGQAEWQTSSGSTALIWRTGADASFWTWTIGFFVFTVASLWTFHHLARVAHANDSR
jgi:membrane protease YdiL (CAAX protease family)